MTPGSLLDWYRVHGRAHLPWRQTRDPYRIVVSEFMLQQTQVDRVIPLYEAFVAAFPDFATLAAADAGDAVRLWRGLGYNSRAMRLHALARAVVERHGGALPSDREALLALPGIGPYTASAVRAFAFELDDVALDTNVRRIAHRTGFGLEHPSLATDAELDARARAALEPGTAHDWNSAMMDIGATICTARAPKCLLCPLRPGCIAAPVDAAQLAERARGASRRSPQESIPFERTTRFLRGRIIDRLRDVPRGDALDLDELIASLAAIVPADRIAEIPRIAATLERDGMIERIEQSLRLR
jgi:A/G-specific adenine glycosylase